MLQQRQRLERAWYCKVMVEKDTGPWMIGIQAALYAAMFYEMLDQILTSNLQSMEPSLQVSDRGHIKFQNNVESFGLVSKHWSSLLATSRSTDRLLRCCVTLWIATYEFYTEGKKRTKKATTWLHSTVHLWESHIAFLVVLCANDEKSTIRVPTFWRCRPISK